MTEDQLTIRRLTDDNASLHDLVAELRRQNSNLQSKCTRLERTLLDGKVSGTIGGEA